MAKLKVDGEFDSSGIKRGAQESEKAFDDVGEAADKAGSKVDQAFSEGGTNRFGGLSGGIQSVGSGLTAIGTAVGVISAGAVAGYTGFVDKTIELSNTANETGIPIEDLAELRKVLDYNGYDFESVEGFFETASELTFEALSGDEGCLLYTSPSPRDS